MRPLLFVVSFVPALSTCTGLASDTPAPPTQEASVSPSFRHDPDLEGLAVRLYDAAGVEVPAERPPVAAARPLSDDATAALLARVEPLAPEGDDRRTFAFRPGSPPPPLPGSDVLAPFPPPPSAPAPDLANGPLHVVRHLPDGEVPLAPHVSITFDQPMVAVTSQDEAAKTAPATLSPRPPGRWRWLGTKTLLFDPEPRLPMATEFTVTVPAGTTSATGGRLEADASFRFATPAASLRGSWPSDGPHDLDPVVVLSFDQRVDPAEVLERVTLEPAAKLRLATPEEVAADDGARAVSENAEPGRWVALRAVEPLARDTTYRIRVPAGLPSAEGPRVTTADQWGAFRTYAPLRLIEHRCGYREPCPPTAWWTIRFENPLDPALFDPGAWKVEPEVPGLSVQMGGDTVQVSGAFAGRTTYTVTAPAGLGDVFGQRLAEPASVKLDVGPAEPRLSIPGDAMVVLDPKGGAKLPIFSTNQSAIKVQVHAVDPTDWSAWRAWLRSLRYDDARPKPLPGRSVFTGSLRPPEARDRQVETALDFTPWLEGGHGQFVILVEPAKQPRERWQRTYLHRWVQVTDLGLTAFVDGEQLVGWATDLQTGASRGGVRLELLGAPDHAETGMDGLASIPLPADEASQLLVARHGADVAILPEDPYPWGGAGWVRRDQLDHLRWYVADDRGLYRPGEEVRVKGWLRRWEHGPKGDLVGLGDGPQGSIAWTLVGSRGDELGKGKVELSGLGGFEIELDLPKDANLGTSELRLVAEGPFDADGTTTAHPIRIEEFRRPEFEVTAAVDQGPHLLGEDATIDLRTSYYAGGSLPASDVTWSVYAEPGAYTPPGWSDWTFGTWTPWWTFGPWNEGRGGGGPIATFTGQTDGGGAHHLGIHFEALNPPRPMSVRAEGTVVDVNRQGWTATATTLLHPASIYVGLKTKGAFVEKGDPVEVQVAVVDLDGEPVAGGRATVEFARLEWGQRRDGTWGEEPVDPVVCDAIAAADGRAACAFDTVRGGTFRLVARVADEHGRPNESELRIWVSGAEVTPARDVELERLALVPEKRELRPGDTARILVQSPFVPAEGALTVRRSGLERVVRFRMDEPTTTLEIPILEAHVPDLTAEVVLVGEAKRLGDDGKPRDDAPKRVAHAAGAITFQVPPLSRTLAVTATPAAPTAPPGGETTIAIEVEGADGLPVSGAEVAVVVADESVLALTGYRLPDPLEVFYAARGDGVTDHHLRSWIALADPERVTEPPPPPPSADAAPSLLLQATASGFAAEEGLAAGAPVAARALGKAERARRAAEVEDRLAPVATGAAEPGPTIATRTDFSALALFAPDVRTDAKGRAAVPVRLPDSLTRYRVMVVVVDAGNRFGSADAAITARLPLMVRPSPPRFLNFGDQLELPIVLQNQTDREMVVDTAVRGTNVRFVDAIGPSLPDLPDLSVSQAGRRVKVPANDRVEVRFPAATVMAGTARLQVVAASGAASDSASFELPVWTPATTEAFATYGEIDQGGVVQPVKAPQEVWTQFGGLEVTASSTQLQALTDAVLYLQSYPFDCNEQIASRVLAIASLRDVLGAFQAEELPPPAELEAGVERDLAQLAARQHWNGGWSFWRRGDETWPFLSIHVANALARAKVKGFRVPDDVWSRSREHLRHIESYIPRWYSSESRWFLRAYALDVRRRMDDADTAEARRLYREAGIGGPHEPGLGIDGLAFLLPTFDEAGAPEAGEILRYLANHVTEQAGTAHFVTSYSDGEHVLLHSDRRADGIVLEALMESEPDSELVAKTVRGLLAHQTKGRWASTQENAFVLLALDRYFQRFEKETPDFVARVWLGDGSVGEHAFRGRTTERAHFEVPMGTLSERADAQPLTLLRDGDAGRLYYRVGLRYAPRDLRLAPADLGFAVERRYEAIDDPADVVREDDGTWRIRAGARVRVTVELANADRRYHVAMVDPLPAGLEAQNPVLATTGTLPASSAPEQEPRWSWWSRPWQEHENLRDERVEAFTSLLWAGAHEYGYVARATTPGRFVVPPARVEEMYSPETSGRSATDIVIVE